MVPLAELYERVRARPPSPSPAAWATPQRVHGDLWACVGRRSWETRTTKKRTTPTPPVRAAAGRASHAACPLTVTDACPMPRSQAPPREVGRVACPSPHPRLQPACPLAAARTGPRPNLSLNAGRELRRAGERCGLHMAAQGSEAVAGPSFPRKGLVGANEVMGANAGKFRSAVEHLVGSRDKSRAGAASRGRKSVTAGRDARQRPGAATAAPSFASAPPRRGSSDGSGTGFGPDHVATCEMIFAILDHGAASTRGPGEPVR